MFENETGAIEPKKNEINSMVGDGDNRHARSLKEFVEGGTELKVQNEIKKSQLIQKKIFKDAGILNELPKNFEIIKENDSEWKLKYNGKRDIFYKDIQGKGVVLEVCFNLTCEHIHKDFKYLMDANLRDKVSTMLWLCDTCDKDLAGKMILDYGEQLRILNRVTFIILKPTAIFPDTSSYAFEKIIDIRPPKQTIFDGIIRKLEQKADKNGLLSAIKIGSIIGASKNWVTNKNKKNRKFPILKAARNSNNEVIRIDDGAYQYKSTDVITFIEEYQKLVMNNEGLTQLVPLISKKENDNSKNYLTLKGIACLRCAPKNSATIKKRLKGKEKGFCISASAAGYSLLYLRSDAESICNIS